MKKPSCAIQVASKSNDKCPSKGEKRRYIGRSHMETEAESGVMGPQTEEGWGPQKLEQARNALPPGSITVLKTASCYICSNKLKYYSNAILIIQRLAISTLAHLCGLHRGHLERELLYKGSMLLLTIHTFKHIVFGSNQHSGNAALGSPFPIIQNDF